MSPPRVLVPLGSWHPPAAVCAEVVFQAGPLGVEAGEAVAWEAFSSERSSQPAELAADFLESGGGDLCGVCLPHNVDPG